MNRATLSLQASSSRWDPPGVSTLSTSLLSEGSDFSTSSGQSPTLARCTAQALGSSSHARFQPGSAWTVKSHWTVNLVGACWRGNQVLQAPQAVKPSHETGHKLPEWNDF